MKIKTQASAVYNYAKNNILKFGRALDCFDPETAYMDMFGKAGGVAGALPSAVCTFALVHSRLPAHPYLSIPISVIAAGATGGLGFIMGIFAGDRLGLAAGKGVLFLRDQNDRAAQEGHTALAGMAARRNSRLRINQR